MRYKYRICRARVHVRTHSRCIRPLPTWFILCGYICLAEGINFSCQGDHYELQRFASWLRDCSRVESHSCKHNWPPVNSLIQLFYAWVTFTTWLCCKLSSTNLQSCVWKYLWRQVQSNMACNMVHEIWELGYLIHGIYLCSVLLHNSMSLQLQCGTFV